MKTCRLLISASATLLLTLPLVGDVDAQSRHMTPASHALGAGGTAYVDTYHANFVNPANLLIRGGDRPRRTVGIYGGLHMTIGGSLANMNTYNRYLTTGQTIRGEVAQDMFDSWFGKGLNETRSLGFDLTHTLFGASYRRENWAASIAARNRVMMSGDMNRGMAELLFLGLDSSIFQTPRAVNMSFETLAFSELSFGFARKMLEFNSNSNGREITLYAGVAPKLLIAQNSARFDLQSQLTISSADENSNSSIHHSFVYNLETTGELTLQME
ncbi:MAG: DUF5723 family protein, partial [Balneolaceae bacterium]